MPDGTTHRPPTPGVFYIHDDLTDEVRERYGGGSEAYFLVQDLFELVRRDSTRVVVLTVEEQIAQLMALDNHRPFAMALGIGRAGQRVARQLHERTGWFPMVRRVDVTREEDAHGGYRLVSTTSESLEVQLNGLEHFPSLAVVDDTVFSGLTLGTVLQTLPAAVLARTHAFCLRCVAETLRAITTMCPISCGFAAPGRILEDVSFINASGLVKRVGIRRAGQPSLAFFDRPEWIRAWFPLHADQVIALCRKLNGLLEHENGEG